MIHEQELIRQFLAAMATRNLALAPGKQLLSDGQWHRCNVSNKPSSGKNDGSYKLCTDGPAPWGLYRNWTDGKDTDYWRGDRNRHLTDAELEELERRMEQARIEAEQMAAEMAAEAAAIAKDTWERAGEAPQDHPYLRKKKVQPHGTRVGTDGNLLVPMHDENGELVNLQFISGTGSKWFLRGGRAKGCCFPIPRDPGDYERVIVCEGFATGASITEATPYLVGVAFSAGNLAAIASNARKFLTNRDDMWWREAQGNAAQRGLVHDRRPNSSNPIPIVPDPEIEVAADDDYQTKNNPGLMKALEAARVADGLIALPRFDEPRPDGATDFNDLANHHGVDAVKEDIDNAMEPQVLLEQRLLGDPYSAHGEAMVEELAKWKQTDAPFYERLLENLKDAGIRKGELDRAVKHVIKVAAAKAAAARARQRSAGEEVDPEALARSAAPLIASANVLGEFARVFAKIYVGEQKNAKLLYLNCTSRLFGLKETMHAVVKGPSSVGKSGLLSTVTAFMPPESVFKFVSLSEKALFYLPDAGNLGHKILLMAEVPKDEKQQQLQNLLLRELMSEGVLQYPVTQKVGDQFETVTIEEGARQLLGQHHQSGG
jgi:phage/plasmid primase-like uncharacterized protein